MHAKAPVYATPSQVRNGLTTIKLKRGGTGGNSGSGPTGYKATARALLARSMAERAGVAQAVKARQALVTEAKKLPRAIIWPGKPSAQSLAIYHG